ncbi:MAG: protein kinase domain-containing protein, partial [Miltoncostaeaceae bacterium]
MANDGIEGSDHPATAELLGGRYRLDELIGRGGMAAVWRATDIEFNRPVAVKRLHARHVDDAEFAERFRREARVVARLSHSHLVRLLDAGEDDNGPYLVLELVEGETLKQRLARDGALPPAEAARVVAQVADALQYAHGQGVVHRDIKSQNVLLGNNGTTKLADFGIARLLEADAEPSLTQTDMMVGSADYIAPEQAEGGAIDARTDIYSLGIVLYETLVGRLPFPGEGFVAVAMKHVQEDLPDPRELDPAVPADLAAVAARAAAKSPDDRFA